MTTPAKKATKKAPKKKVAVTEEVVPSPAKSEPAMLTGATYDFVNRLARLILPAVGALYLALSQIWGLPGAEKVVGSIVAVNVFLGAVVTVSANRYKNSDAKFDGVMEVAEGESASKYNLVLNDHPETLKDKDQIVFKVNKTAL